MLFPLHAASVTNREQNHEYYKPKAKKTQGNQPCREIVFHLWALAFVAKREIEGHRHLPRPV